MEDMDLAVRAGLKGWKFVYLGDLQVLSFFVLGSCECCQLFKGYDFVFVLQQVKSELPSTFKAFRFQQHRWSCGPANLFRKMVMEIVRNKVNFLMRPKNIYFLDRNELR